MNLTRRIGAGMLAVVATSGIALAASPMADATPIPKPVAPAACFGVQAPNTIKLAPRIANSYHTYYYSGVASNGYYEYRDVYGNGFDSDTYLGRSITVNCAS
jgi:hypothetical protein